MTKQLTYSQDVLKMRMESVLRSMDKSGITPEGPSPCNIHTCFRRECKRRSELRRFKL